MNCSSCATVLAPQATFCKTCGRLVEDPLVGTMISERYRIQAKIAVGGFGAIYRATQVTTNRRVAIKVMHRELSNDEHLVARFRREAATLCSLRDAHTVTTYELAQTTDGRLFIVMELLEGRNLLELFRASGRLPWRRVLSIARSVCSSLAEAHSLGIVHRDLKPANIFLEDRHGGGDFVKVLDFGIAKIMQGSGIDDGSELTITGQAVGTLEYMAPEQLIGGKCDGRTDIYTLGVVAFEMITGRRPFASVAATELLAVQLAEKPPLPSSFPVVPAVPPGADRILLSCLARDESERFPDVQALAAAIDELFAAIDHAAQARTATAPGLGVSRGLATPSGGTRNIATPPPGATGGLAAQRTSNPRLPGTGPAPIPGSGPLRFTAPSGLAGVTAPMAAEAEGAADSADPVELAVTAETTAPRPPSLLANTVPETPPARLLVGGAAAAASRLDPLLLGEEETAVGAPPDTFRDPPVLNAQPDTFRDAAVPIPIPAVAIPIPATPRNQRTAPVLPLPPPRPQQLSRGRISLLRAALWLVGLLAVGIGAGILIAELAA